MCAIARDCLWSTWKDGDRAADSLRNVGFKCKASPRERNFNLDNLQRKNDDLNDKKRKRKRTVESLTMEISSSETKIGIFCEAFLTQEHCSLKYLRTARISQWFFFTLSLPLSLWFSDSC